VSQTTVREVLLSTVLPDFKVAMAIIEGCGEEDDVSKFATA